MINHLTTVWRYRHFWLSMVKMDLKTRYRRSFLGVGWSLAYPILMTVVFCVIFGAWFNNPDWRTYGPYFLAGMTIFSFVRDSVLIGTSTFYRNESYIRQFPLPLTIYTLRTVLGAAVHFSISMAVTIVAVFVLRPEQGLKMLSVMWVLIPAIIMLFLFCWSISILSSYMTAFFHDTVQLVEVVFQILFFLTPLMYPMSMLVDRGLTILLKLNPIVVFLELIREPILSGELPPIWAFGKAAIFILTFGSMAIGTIAKLEKRMIFHL